MKIQSIFLYFLLLMLTSCLIAKKNPKELTDLFPLTTRNPKSIVFRQDTIISRDYSQGADFYVFFPDENIYICDPGPNISSTHIGFYSLSSNEDGLILITKPATNHVVMSDNIKAESKRSLDSLYFCIKLSSTPIFNKNKKNKKIYSIYEEPIILINNKYPALASNLITVQQTNKSDDSLNVIFTIPQLDSIKSIEIVYNLFLSSAKFDVDTIHNYYTQTGNICILLVDDFDILFHHTVDTMPILALGNNKYQLKDYHTTPIYDTIQKKIMHIKLPYNFKQYYALNKFERAYIYALPQYIKALECAGTYPQK